MKESRNLIPKIGIALVAAFFVYAWSVAGFEATGSPVELFGVPGAILLYAAIITTFATIVVAARRAHRSGSWSWFATVILLWPLSYLYTLAINRRD